MLSYKEFKKKANGSFFPGSTMPAPTTRPSAFAPGTTLEEQNRQNAWNDGFAEGLGDALKVQGKSIWNQATDSVNGTIWLGGVAAKGIGYPFAWASDKIFGTNLRQSGGALIDAISDAAQKPMTYANNIVQNSDLYKDHLSDTDRTIASLSTVPLMVAGETALAGGKGASRPAGQVGKAGWTGIGLMGLGNANSALHEQEQPSKRIVQTASPEQRQIQAQKQQEKNKYNGLLSTGLAAVAGALGTNLFLAATPALRKKRIMRLWLSLAAGAGAGYLGWKYAQGKQ